MTNILYDALIAPHAGSNRVFLDCDDGTSVTYGAFVDRAAQMANALHAAGVRAGCRVVVQGPKTADAIALFAGALQAGAVYLPLNTAYTQAEVGYFIQDAAPTLIVCAPKDQDSIQQIANGVPVLTLDGSLTAAANAQPTTFRTAARGPDDLAALLYTSGTTGRSKGAMMSHRNLLSNAKVLVGLWQMSETDRFIHALPIFHTHGLFVALNTSLIAGVRIRLIGRFDLDAVLSALPTATLMMGVPTFYTRLLGDMRFDAARCKSMRLFISGSAPLLAETHTAFEARTGHRILERYGMTETNMITSNPYAGDRVAGTVGMALPGCDVRIMTNDAPAHPGQIGMIEVRGDNVFQGYWNMPEKTAEDLRSDGFFVTGDLGMMDAEGRVSIIGRAKDLIIAGGYNIYPKEIEDVLNTCEGVLETAVFGVPHHEFGESVVAAIVTDGAPVDETDLRHAVTAALAKFKHPRRYVMLDVLPRNTMGKVQKNILRKDYADG